MPIYVYKCESCGFAKDVLQKMSAAPLTDCPTCGAATFRKQLTSAGFQLKGSGWYATDFKSAVASSDGAAKPAVTAPPAAETTSAPAIATVAATATATPASGCGEACACH